MLDPYAKAVSHKPDLSSSEARSIFFIKMMKEIMQQLHLKGRIVDEHFDWSGIVSRLSLWVQNDYI